MFALFGACKYIYTKTIQFTNIRNKYDVYALFFFWRIFFFYTNSTKCWLFIQRSPCTYYMILYTHITHMSMFALHSKKVCVCINVHIYVYTITTVVRWNFTLFMCICLFHQVLRNWIDFFPLLSFPSIYVHMYVWRYVTRTGKHQR